MFGGVKVRNPIEVACRQVAVLDDGPCLAGLILAFQVVGGLFGRFERVQDVVLHKDLGVLPAALTGPEVLTIFESRI